MKPRIKFLDEVRLEENGQYAALFSYSTIPEPVGMGEPYEHKKPLTAAEIEEYILDATSLGEGADEITIKNLAGFQSAQSMIAALESAANVRREQSGIELEMPVAQGMG